MGNSVPNGLAKSTNALAQNLSANCDLTCTKIIDGKKADPLKAGRNRFAIQEKCSVNGDCLMASSIGPLATIFSGFPDSSNAEEARKLLPPGFPGEKDWDDVSWSRQETNTVGTQTLLNACNITDTTTIANVKVLTTSQKFKGPIAIVNADTLNNNCFFPQTLTASALAMATHNNGPLSGKNKKWAIGKSLAIVLLAFLGGLLLTGRAIWVHLNPPR